MIQLKNSQRGITLIELLVALVIAGVIIGGVSTAIFQVLAGNAQTSAQMTATKDVEKAIYSITRDVQTSQRVTLNQTSTNRFPLTLNWVEWDNTANSVVYDIKNGQLQRVLTIVKQQPPETTIFTTIVVRNVNADAQKTNCNLTDQGAISFKITSSIGGLRPESETRTFMVIPKAVP